MKIGVVKVRNIDYVDLVDKDTGEILSSAMTVNDTLKISSKTDKSVVTYNDYSVFSSRSVVALSVVLSVSDLGRLLLIGQNVRTPLNVVSVGNRPATNKMLIDYLGFNSHAMYYRFIGRLVAAGVLSKVKSEVGRCKLTIYLMNPYLCRKRKVFDNVLFEMFKKFDNKD